MSHRSGGISIAVEVATERLTVILAHPRSGKSSAARRAQWRPRRVILDDPFDDQMTADQMHALVDSIVALSGPLRVVVLGTPTPHTRFAWELLVDKADKVQRFRGEPNEDYRLYVGDDYYRVACELATDVEVAA